MAWLSSRRQLWAQAPRKFRIAGIASMLAAVLVLFLGFYCTTGDRQAQSSAAAHYTHSKAVSDAVTVYTNSCNVLAASRNIRTLSGLSDVSVLSALSSADQARQDVWNVNAILASDDSSVSVFFPVISLSVTKNQFKFSADFSRIFSASYPGLPYEKLLSQGPGSWHSYYSNDFCYIVRSILVDGQAAAYIVAKFPVTAIFGESGREVFLIGDDSTCLYASRTDLPDDLYDSLLLSLDTDRLVSVNGVQYYTIRNEFSNISLRFFTLVPVLSRKVLTIRIVCSLAFLILLSAPVILLSRRKKAIVPAQQTEQSPLPPNGAEPVSVRHYTLSGLTKTLMDLEKERDYRISQQCYGLLRFTPDETCVVTGFALLEDQERLFDSPRDGDSTRRPVTPYFILNNMLQDLLFSRHSGGLCYCGGKYIAISNLLPGETEADIQAAAEQVAASAKNYLYLAFVTAGPFVSNGYQGFHAALTQVSQQLDYERLWWRTERAPASDAQNLNTVDFYNRLGLLSSCILENNFIKAEETFCYILQNCIPTQIQQVKEAEGRLELLLETILSLTGYSREKLPANALPPKTIAVCQSVGRQILQAQISAKTCTNPAKDRIRAISEYVQAHYADSDLGVGTIAARFGMNAAYLSRTFKDGTGMNLLEYIHRTRVSAAKKLLPEYAIKEVWPMVGFADGQSFVRIFRKYESVSPAEFKRNCAVPNDSLPK